MSSEVASKSLAEYKTDFKILNMTNKTTTALDFPTIVRIDDSILLIEPVAVYLQQCGFDISDRNEYSPEYIHVESDFDEVMSVLDACPAIITFDAGGYIIVQPRLTFTYDEVCSGVDNIELVLDMVFDEYEHKYGNVDCDESMTPTIVWFTLGLLQRGLLYNGLVVSSSV